MPITSHILIDPDTLTAPHRTNTDTRHDRAQHRVVVFDADGCEAVTWLTIEQAGRVVAGWIRTIADMAMAEYGNDGDATNLNAPPDPQESIPPVVRFAPEWTKPAGRGRKVGVPPGAETPF